MTAVLLLSWSVQGVRACNVPVFRYAMYNWAPAPYRVYYLHHGRVAEEDEAVNKQLAELPDAEPAPANVALKVVDLSQAEQVEQLPDVVEKVRRSHAEGDAPMHLVFTPWGAKVFAGRLDSTTVEAMIDSPVRKRLGELLSQGNATVLLILAGPDGSKNERAEKAVAEVIKAVAAGKITADTIGGPAEFMPDVPNESPAGDRANEAPEPLKVASLKVSRTDPAEKLLVEMLLAIEPDLHDKEFAEEAMIFAIFGRGLASPPYVGKGISVENLTDCVAFLLGDCSCTIKSSNPGADLLFRWDWEATAESLAAADERADGGPWGYQEFTPDASGNRHRASLPGPQAAVAASSPSSNSPQSQAEKNGGAPAVAAPSPSSNSPQSQAEKNGKAPAVAAAAPSPKNPKAATAKAPETPGQAVSENRPQSEPGSFAARQLWKYAIGLAAGIVVVFMAGFILIVRQRPG